MKDEEKSKKELISELNVLRRKYTDLKELYSKNQGISEIGGTETILIVDDNKQTRTIVIKMLENQGYNLLEADSSKKAIEISNSYNGTIHLVISDVVMPEMNGPEMVKMLSDVHPKMKIVFMSGYAEEAIIHDDVLKIVDSAYPFIEKPFTSIEIDRIVRQQLDKKTKRVKNDK